jgi:hypothetical protein
MAISGGTCLAEAASAEGQRNKYQELSDSSQGYLSLGFFNCIHFSLCFNFRGFFNCLHRLMGL